VMEQSHTLEVLSIDTGGGGEEADEKGEEESNEQHHRVLSVNSG
jgi:hypothetical protein